MQDVDTVQFGVHSCAGLQCMCQHWQAICANFQRASWLAVANAKGQVEVGMEESVLRSFFLVDLMTNLQSTVHAALHKNGACYPGG